MTSSSDPLMTVVIPTYNRAKYIERTIQSVLNQEYHFFELIVVDDGSTDNTEHIVLSIQDSRIVYCKKINGERASARNYGIQKAKGDFVTFLDSDDLLKTNHLRVAANFLLRYQDLDVFHLGYDVISEDHRVIYPWKPLPDPVNFKLAEGNFLSCLGVFVKRSVLLENPFNEDRIISGSEDYELWIRLAARYTIRTCAISTACLVNHETRSVLQPDRFVLENRIMLTKHYLQEDDKVQNFYGSRFKIICAYLDLYCSLHLAMSGFRLRGWYKLIQAVLLHFRIVLNYRFWAAIKNLILP